MSNINVDDYRVIVISREVDIEKRFLEGISTGTGNIGFVSCKRKWKSDNGSKSNCFVFAFIVVKNNDQKNEQATNAISNMEIKDKTIIVYAHSTDSLVEKEIRKVITNGKGKVIEYKPFSHQPNDLEYDPLANFTGCVGDKKEGFGECLKELIEESLKKKNRPHIIALSILCQGYLAAHEGKDLNGWNDSMIGLLVSDAETKTEDKSWWQPAFEKKDNEKEIKQSDDFSQTIISDEISSIGKACKDSSAIKNLFDKIKGLNVQSFCDTDKVIATYNCIKELL